MRRLLVNPVWTQIQRNKSDTILNSVNLCDRYQGHNLRYRRPVKNRLGIMRLELTLLFRREAGHYGGRGQFVERTAVLRPGYDQRPGNRQSELSNGLFPGRYDTEYCGLMFASQMEPHSYRFDIDVVHEDHGDMFTVNVRISSMVVGEKRLFG